MQKKHPRTQPETFAAQRRSLHHLVYTGVLLVAVLTGSNTEVTQAADSWTQFRGHNGNGHAIGSKPLPADVGPDKHVVWKSTIPPGHSSPAVHGDRIFLTGVNEESLVTVGLDRATGEVRWTRVARHDGKESIHRVGSYAQSSPVTDGERVVSFFGSAGLFCYDRNGKDLWSLRLGPFKNGFGAGSSPIIVDDRVILSQDHDTDSFLLALDKRTGEQLWKKDRSIFPRGYSTPIIWTVAGKPQIVVAGTLQATGYDFETGDEIWNVRGLARIVNTTPVIGEGMLFIATWSPGADSGERIQPKSFDEVARDQDANKNGSLESGEIQDEAIKARFNQLDRDKNDRITRAECDYMKNIFETARNAVIAIKPGGKGDVTESHVAWSYERNVPYVPSPLYHAGHIYMVKDGGIATCLDAKTGERKKQIRLSSRDNYYSSPVYGDGKIYAVSQRGRLSVLSAQQDLEEVATADFGEDAYATPAIVDGRIYLRTAERLYCLGKD